MTGPKTLELAHKQVDECKRYHPDHCKYYGCLFARALVDRETPVSGSGHRKYANCQYGGFAVNRGMNYCPNCGKPLDWSEGKI